MKRFTTILACVAAALAVSDIACAAERNIVVPKDNKPFKVSATDIVRLKGSGIAGAAITANVEGPAKIEATNKISERANGEPLLGIHVTEFEIKPTGKGKVKVRITVKPPQPGSKPEVADYEFTVE